jgi:hypothetical protein
LCLRLANENANNVNLTDEQYPAEQKPVGNVDLRLPLKRSQEPCMEDLDDDELPFLSKNISEEEIVDYDLGFLAGTEGKPQDNTKSVSWQRGWAKAQE